MASQKKIRFLYDEKGKKTDVLLSISQYEELIEDQIDAKIIQERKNEKPMTLSEFKAKLKKNNG